MRRMACISMLLLPLLAQTAWADVVLIVRKQAEASGNYVRVCDIARVEGPRDQAREVANTVLGPTPPKGRAQEITRWDIENRLSEMGVAARVSFSGNDTVKVYGNGSRMSAASDDPTLLALEPMDRRSDATDSLRFADRPETSVVASAMASSAARSDAFPAARQASASPLESLGAETRDVIGKAISQYLAGRYKRPDIEVEATVKSLSGLVPEGAYEIKVEEALDGRVPGRASLRLSYRETAESQPVPLTVAADTEVYGLALVAGRPLFRNETLSAGDVRAARVRMVSGKRYFPPTPTAIEGRQLKTGVKAGDAVLVDETEPTEEVKRGDIVQVVTSARGWELRSNGKALGGGKTGDLVKVEDTATKAKYNARVTGRGTVTVLPSDWRTEK